MYLICIDPDSKTAILAEANSPIIDNDIQEMSKFDGYKFFRAKVSQDDLINVLSILTNRGTEH